MRTLLSAETFAIPAICKTRGNTKTIKHDRALAFLGLKTIAAGERSLIREQATLTVHSGRYCRESFVDVGRLRSTPLPLLEVFAFHQSPAAFAPQSINKSARSPHDHQLVKPEMFEHGYAKETQQVAKARVPPLGHFGQQDCANRQSQAISYRRRKKQNGGAEAHKAKHQAQRGQYVARQLDCRPDNLKQGEIRQPKQSDRAITRIKQHAGVLDNAFDCSPLPSVTLCSQYSQALGYLGPTDRIGHKHNAIRFALPGP